MQTGGRVRNKIYEIRLDSFTSFIVLLAADDDVDDAIEIRTLQPPIPTDSAN
jgi:hypothetical protein